MQAVLIVEPEDAMRALVREWVDTLGYRAREAGNAQEALQALARERAAVLLCAVRLPDRSGVWLASHVREHFPDTAIVIATVVRDVETAVASLRNEVVDYLLKPFDRSRLGEAIALARDWHHAAAGIEDLHEGLQDRLRTRRAAIASALSAAQETTATALEGLMALLQLHERDGRGHATRVARLAAAIGDQLGIADDELSGVEHGALLHDIGKLRMPASILSKPAPLDEREWQVMRTHPQAGFDLLRDQPRFAAAAEIVLSHHEAYDGSGYPRGLQRDEIPLGARILAVADAYDSMTQPHIQRPPLPPALAMSEVERCSGSQFDPDCAAALGPVLAHVMS